MITQETSSQSARTSVASGGRLSILSEKLSRLSISSNQSGRPSVASDSVLLHKKGETGRLSQSYEDSDARAISAHYTGRRTSKAPRLSTVDNENRIVNQGKNIRFQLFPRSSDAVEQSISSVDQSSGVFEEQSIETTRRSISKIDSNQNPTPTRRQSLLRSPSSRYAIPKFPVVGKQSTNAIRTSIPPSEQAFLSPPMSPQTSFHTNKNKTLRGALGAIMPDLYFIGTACTANNDTNVSGGITTNNNGIINERINDELTIVEEILHKLHIRIIYEEHRNDLVVNIIEGRLTIKHEEILYFLFSPFILAKYLPIDREELANPYVKIYLRPPIDQKLRQTSVQPQTINPVWNEYFKFNVANETVFKTIRTLYFYIYNYAHSSRPECIGEAQLRLTSQTLRTGGDLWCLINKQRAVEEKVF